MQLHRSGRLPVSSVAISLVWVLAIVGFVLLTMRLPAGTAPVPAKSHDAAVSHGS